MKKLIIIAGIILIAVASNLEANTNYSKRAEGYFYTSLSPHGSWIEIGLGTPVWRPTIIKKNWSPYYYGQWVYTDYGWYWDSYEPFGYIVYHYGRWYYDDYYGWLWIPDYEWAPAWVEWRYDDFYIGWAPMSPYVNFYVSFGLHYSYNYYVPYNHWQFVKYNYFGHKYGYNYCVAPKYKNQIYESTKYRTNYSYYNGRIKNEGIEYDRIREKSGRKIEKRNLITVNDPVEISRNKSNREVRTYIAKRDEISRDEFRDIKVERGDRKSTLDLTKVELGRYKNTDINKERNNDNISDRKDIREKNSRDISTSERTDQLKKEIGDIVNRNRADEDKKIREQRELDKRNSEIEKRNNDRINKNESVNRSREDNRSNSDLSKQNSRVEVQKKQDVKVTDQRNMNNERTNRNKDITREENTTKSDDKSEKDNKTRNR
jgi:hypothetical protein